MTPKKTRKSRSKKEVKEKMYIKIVWFSCTHGEAEAPALISDGKLYEIGN